MPSLSSSETQRRSLRGPSSPSSLSRATPLAFWTDVDVHEYIEAEGVEYSALYDMGYKRSGCMFCMFGVHLDKTPNRFQLMKKTHPKQWKYCTGRLGCRRVLKHIGVAYE